MNNEGQEFESGFTHRIILIGKGCGLLAVIIVGLLLFFLLSCTPTHHMVKPDTCYPQKKKEAKREMVHPKPKMKRHGT